ncbi:conserved hypothetical protein [delta proteobacterium NaphS2]|nr:conserved hypothetical protein [delta proteobacterium NaphS2]
MLWLQICPTEYPLITKEIILDKKSGFEYVSTKYKEFPCLWKILNLKDDMALKPKKKRICS